MGSREGFGFKCEIKYGFIFHFAVLISRPARMHVWHVER